ncbi:MAG: hypothetical protein M0Z69_15330, partial [Actinomycetota bacterium]|nr:hypothetical protein [Actinomycetota bacterium]
RGSSSRATSARPLLEDLAVICQDEQPTEPSAPLDKLRSFRDDIFWGAREAGNRMDARRRP